MMKTAKGPVESTRLRDRKTLPTAARLHLDEQQRRQQEGLHESMDHWFCKIRTTMAQIFLIICVQNHLCLSAV
eukprot:4110558-Amphidinium_carterae.1